MNVSNIITMNYKNLSRLWGKKTKPKQTQLKSCPERSRISVFCLLFSVLCPLSSVHGNENKGREQTEEFTQVLFMKIRDLRDIIAYRFKEKFSKISIISIRKQAKLTKYHWKITPAAAIFNQIKKLTITRTSDNLKGRRVIWRFESLLIWGIGICFWEIEKCNPTSNCSLSLF
jgi:hypothetical protein